MKPIKVLYICGGRNFRSQSPGQKIAGVINCWRQMGYEVKHVCGGDIAGAVPGADEREYGAASFHRKWYRRIGILNPLIRSISEWRDIQHDAAMAQHLEGICDSFKPDLIWERSCRLHCAGLIAAKRIGVPYVLEWKDNIASYWLSWYCSRARRMEKRKNHEADFIVVESGVLRSNLIEHGIESLKIIVAHNAVDPLRFRRDAELGKKVREELGVKADTVLAGYLGSYAWYHNTPLLVEAFNILKRRGVENIRCLMVGSGKEYDETRRLAEKYGLLGAEIIMRPGVPNAEVPKILGALDIALLPGSTDIICPVKIQEYMACELASVAPDYACNREVIEDGRTGMLFAPKDAAALADKISLLAGDCGLRSRLGRQAGEEIRNRFTWEKTWGAALDKVAKAKQLAPDENV